MTTEAGPLSRAEIEAVLRSRAETLAQPLGDEKEQDVALEVLEFRLASEHYGIETAAIREVALLRAFTPLPAAPAFVMGVVNVHGRVVSVLNLKQLFELEVQGLSDMNRVIVLGDDRMEFGILADSILRTRQVPLSGVQKSLPTLTGTRARSLYGVTPERLVILDAARLLGDRELVVHQQI